MKNFDTNLVNMLIWKSVVHCFPRLAGRNWERIPRRKKMLFEYAIPGTKHTMEFEAKDRDDAINTVKLRLGVDNVSPSRLKEATKQKDTKQKVS